MVNKFAVALFVVFQSAGLVLAQVEKTKSFDELPQAKLVSELRTFADEPKKLQTHLTSDGKKVVIVAQFPEAIISIHETSSGKLCFDPIPDPRDMTEIRLGKTIGVSVSPNNDIVLTRDTHNIHLWQMSDGKPLRAALRFKETIYSAAFNKDASTILVGLGSFESKNLSQIATGKISLFNTKTGAMLAESAVIADGVPQAVWSPDFKAIATVPRALSNFKEGFTSRSPKAMAMFWDANLKPLGEPISTGTNPFSDAKFSQDGSVLYLTGITGIKRLTCVDPKQSGKYVVSKFKDATTASQVAMTKPTSSHPDGKHAFTTDFKRVHCWNLAGADPDLVSTLEHRQPVYWIIVSPDGKYLASASASLGRPGDIVVWDLDKKQATIRVLQPGRVMSMEFAPDGNTLVVGTDDCVKAWRLKK